MIGQAGRPAAAARGSPTGAFGYPPSVAETLFYDGDCGFCHWTVRFVLARDRGDAFRFAPIQGETFRAQMGEAQFAALPDSVFVLTEDGQWLERLEAVIHVLRRLGGGWALLAALFSLFPRALRDWGYDLFARHRRRLFARPDAACPVLPPALRARFDP